DASLGHDVEVVGLVADLLALELGRVDAEGGALAAADAEVERVAVDDEPLALGEPAALPPGVGEGAEHALGAHRVVAGEGEAVVRQVLHVCLPWLSLSNPLPQRAARRGGRGGVPSAAGGRPPTPARPRAPRGRGGTRACAPPSRSAPERPPPAPSGAAARPSG